MNFWFFLTRVFNTCRSVFNNRTLSISDFCSAFFECGLLERLFLLCRVNFAVILLPQKLMFDFEYFIKFVLLPIGNLNVEWQQNVFVDPIWIIDHLRELVFGMSVLIYKTTVPKVPNGL